VRRDGGTSDLTETGQDVDDTWGETRLLDQLACNEGGERSLLGSLEDDSVTARDGGTDLPCPHEQREVPRDDLTADTKRLLLGVVECVGGSVDDLALDLVRPTSVVPQGSGAHAHVTLRHGDGLAVVKRLDGGEDIEVLVEQVAELVQQLSALLGINLPPRALESFPCSGDGNVDILLGGLVDGADDTLVGGVYDLKGLAV